MLCEPKGVVLTEEVTAFVKPNVEGIVCCDMSGVANGTMGFPLASTEGAVLR
jgi:hypothetical protein